MTTDEIEPRCSLPVWLIVAAVLLPVGYMLSTGPARWLYSHGYFGEETAAILGLIFYPIDWLSRQYGPVLRVMKWYFSLWE